ncbi:transformer-sr ribonucleoprotein [Stylonychia lemnae]|uniref:Transformer-sr ribonucleoprotein n=1 Tax=Stylonychia lemnae TaxID=5949 RepID=A0A078B3F8_STYLE|nr:transformer-sr ribonucleoprotein [Stylonychia lemnae]|eukprot:CDW88979.1 transformer-sr ribonucleoprotein [Stylonychia lemnae]
MLQIESRERQTNEAEQSAGNNPESPNKNLSSWDRDKSHSETRSNDKHRRSKSNDSAKNNEGVCLYVANLSKRVNDRDLEQLFEKYGKLQKCTVVIDPITSESRCFAFVIFENKDEAEEAERQLHKHNLHGKEIIVEKSKRLKPREATPGRYMGKPKRYPQSGRSGRYGDESRRFRDGSRSPENRVGGRYRRNSRSRSRGGGYDDRNRDRNTRGGEIPSFKKRDDSRERRRPRISFSRSRSRDRIRNGGDKYFGSGQRIADRTDERTGGGRRSNDRFTRRGADGDFYRDRSGSRDGDRYSFRRG